MNTNSFRLAGWSALTVAILTLLTIVTFGIGVNAGWDKVKIPNDLATALMYLLHPLVLAGLDKSMARPRPAQLTIGILAALYMATVQILYIADAGVFESTPVSAILSTAILSLVYLIYNWQARREQSLPNGLTIVGVIANAGGALASASSIIAENHPLVWIGGSLYMLNVVWLIWLGRIWLRNA
ncbi:MAG: hypothetical protein FJZ87_05775 [Chloroflexi bacterium]|nr:hypothetical protein [Chloroflexota bacterium]